jgi:predicted outer membrane repeat protein
MRPGGEVMRWLLLLASPILVLLSITAFARTWYITPLGTGDAPTIQAGIDSATAADTVLLADGTYTGDGNRDIDFGGKAITVISESGDPELCVISCGGSEAEAHRGFVFGSGETGATVLEGVTVQEGYMAADGGSYPDYAGAGVICYNFSSPTIRRCDLIGNTARLGGAIGCSNASPVITACAFRGNEAFDWTGGAIMCTNSGSPVISGCTFEGNSAATDFPNQPSAGGAIAILDPSAPVITGCEFRANAAVFGGAVWYFPLTTVVITDCVFSQNTADEGGAIACRFDSYPSKYSLGKAGDPTSVSGCTFDGNSAARGGALCLANSDEISITGCTLYGNMADQGSGIYLDYFVALLERTIVSFGETGEAICACGGELNNDITLTCCDIYGNAGGDWVDVIAAQLGTGGNICEDPLFCSTAGGDFTVETCSPCLPENHPDGYDCGGMIGAWGSGCGCGTAVEPTTWSAIKSLHR